MATYNLTEKQKKLLTTIVEHIKTGQLEEPIITSCTFSGCEIIGIDEKFGHNLLGDLESLCDADLMGYCYNSNGNKKFSVKQAGYEAIINNFVIPEKSVSPQFNIGAIVGEINGGTLQAIGLANGSDVKQIVNDPQLLATEINSLTNQLLEVIKADLSADKLLAYINQIDELKKEVTSEKPSQSVLQRLFNSLAFMGDIEGTISLAARVWPYIYPILVIAAQKIMPGG